MHTLAVLFFFGLMSLSALLIRNMVSDADAKIGSALAGEYRPAAATVSVVYIARRRSPALVRPRTAAPARLAA